MSVNITPQLPSPKILDIIGQSSFVRGHFKNWIDQQFKGIVSIKDIAGYHEMMVIGIVYNYITKLDININTYQNNYDVYFVNYNDKELEELEKMKLITIIEKYQMDYYIERQKPYNASLMQGMKLAIIDTINFLNNTQWLKERV